MTKHIQITEDLFVSLCKYHLFGVDDEQEEIIKGLNEKLDAIERRDLYGKSVKGDEEARKKYLDLIGMRDSFRW